MFSSFWVDITGKVRHRPPHHLCLLLKEPDAFLRFTQLSGFFLRHAGDHPVLDVSDFQPVQGSREIPKSFAIWTMVDSPLRATATSSGKALGMFNILHLRAKTHKLDVKQTLGRPGF